MNAGLTGKRCSLAVKETKETFKKELQSLIVFVFVLEE